MQHEIEKAGKKRDSLSDLRGAVEEWKKEKEAGGFKIGAPKAIQPITVGVDESSFLSVKDRLQQMQGGDEGSGSGAGGASDADKK